MTERYKPRKLKSVARAVREHCIECCGGRMPGHDYITLIKECPATECALHDFRFGHNPFNKKTLSTEQLKVKVAMASKLATPDDDTPCVSI